MLQTGTKGEKMVRKKEKINAKLKKLGEMLDLEDSDITRAKITVKSILSVAILSAIVLIIGKFTVTQLDAIGLYYSGVSIRDFNLFSGFV